MKPETKSTLLFLLKLPFLILAIAWNCIKYTILFLDWVLPVLPGMSPDTPGTRYFRARRTDPLRHHFSIKALLKRWYYRKEFSSRRNRDLFDE